MERLCEIIDLCDSVDRKDLSEFLQGLVETIKPFLEEQEDSDFEGEASSSDEEIDEGEPPNSHKKIQEEDYKVKIDEDGFWSFVFSDDED